MNVQASDFTNNSHNFTNVTFIIEDGSLKITPKSINQILKMKRLVFR